VVADALEVVGVPVEAEGAVVAADGGAAGGGVAAAVEDLGVDSLGAGGELDEGAGGVFVHARLGSADVAAEEAEVVAVALARMVARSVLGAFEAGVGLIALGAAEAGGLVAAEDSAEGGHGGDADDG